MSGANSPQGGLTRRSFLKTTGLAIGAGVAGVSLSTLDGAEAVQFEDGSKADEGEVITTTICRSNCSQACLFNVHARDGKVVKLTPKEYETELYSGCCLRGLSMQERTYSDKRVKYPMRRVGERKSKISTESKHLPFLGLMGTGALLTVPAHLWLSSQMRQKRHCKGSASIKHLSMRRFVCSAPFAQTKR